jgi:8-oxo-(d)GTP phosphatase
VIHRPRRAVRSHPDWSLPKGKLDRGESPLECAVRETREETGLVVRLGPALARQRYPLVSGATKIVDYWLATVKGDDDLSGYAQNAEVDDVRWLPITAARKRLTFKFDRDMLRGLGKTIVDTRPLLVIRHTQARNRSRWRGPDTERTLTKLGQVQADHLVSWIEPYGVTRVVSSNASRCIATVQPFADRSGAKVLLEPALSEERATDSRVRKAVKSLLTSSRRVAICSHRPVLPLIFEALGLESVSLPPGGIVAVHRSDGVVVQVDNLAERKAETWR